ncbi:MAG: FAD/NAD(P)-binding protein [Pyrinomonadaceae bacterium]
MRRITIIGGGASGTLLALNLLKYKGERRLEINLVEKRPHIGRGVAFSTEEDAHLLNVPAAKMGAYADDVEHFHRWLNENEMDYSATAFVPRRIFGEYLREQLEEANKNKADNVELNIFDDEAVDLQFEGGKAHVQLASGDHIYSEKVALAFGNFLPPHPTVLDQTFVDSAKYFQDPWTPEVFDSITPDDNVLIVGTGLSMVDVTMQLYKLCHKGLINAISTRGQLPAVHKLGFTYPSFYEEIKGSMRVTDILKTVRVHSKKADANGSDWRAVIDSLRPVTQQIWLDLPLAEKKYFMQHLSRYWNVARHRMAPEAALIIDELRGTGQLQILKGRLQKITWEDDIGFDVRYATIGLDQYVHADVIINCIGSESRFDQLDSRLVKNLINAGMIRCDDLRFGLDATPDGHLKARDGRASDMLYTLGTALKGVLWESTAIPEIRIQARDLAQKLISE